VRAGRCTYNCTKAPTGPLNRKALLDYIYEQAKKTPDKAEYVPHVPGVVRGTKWVPPPQVTSGPPVLPIRIHLDQHLFGLLALDLECGSGSRKAQMAPQKEGKTESFF